MSTIESCLELPSSLLAEADGQRLVEIENLRRRICELEERPSVEQALDFCAGDDENHQSRFWKFAQAVGVGMKGQNAGRRIVRVQMRREYPRDPMSDWIVMASFDDTGFGCASEFKVWETWLVEQWEKYA